MDQRAYDERPVHTPAAKALLGWLVAAALLLLTLPISVAAVLAIAVEGLLRPEMRGPVIHYETRVSKGCPFRLMKFRILKTDAIRVLIGERGLKPKDVENDPANVTGVGRLLKKTGLDEVPQFVNILKGEMTMVGPRPKPVAEYEAEVAEGVLRRKVIQAGLTGPAQLLKGTQRTAEDDLRADLDYIERVRTWPSWKVVMLDIRLMLRTVRLLLKFTGE